MRLTADAAGARSIKMTPSPETRQLLRALEDELAHVHSIHLTYKKLFKSDQQTRNLLADSDFPFFSDLRIVYLGYISVAVSRLLDPPHTGKKANLSLFHLVELLKEQGAPQSTEWLARLETCKAQAYNFTDPRNQLVSHLDLAVNLGDENKRAIPSFITKEFDVFHETTGDILNDIRAYLEMPHNHYEWGIVGHGHGRKLLHRLTTAFDVVQQRLEPDAD